MSGAGEGVSRRAVLGAAGKGLLAGGVVLRLPGWAWGQLGSGAVSAATRLADARTQGEATTRPGEARSRVGLVYGPTRAGNILAALQHVEPEVRRSLVGKKRVLIKPNVVSVTQQLAATHADCVQGLLEFFAPLTREIIVADSAASGPATEGFDNYGYTRLQKDYRVRFLDLDREPVVLRPLADHRYRPQMVRWSQLLMDPETYVVSAAVMKTHDRAVVTLSLKNLVVGGVIKDGSYRWRADSRGRNDKWVVHGGPANQAINYNLFTLARMRSPDLAVIDGFTGMEGNGPINGTAVEHQVAVASTDWLAADRVAVELMGFEFAKVGYLSFCAAAGMGQADLGQLEIVGEPLARHVRRYRPHEKVAEQYKWME